MKKKISLVLFLVLALTSMLVYAEEENEITYITEKAKVLEVGDLEETGEETFTGYSQEVRVLVLSGEYKGKEMVLENIISDNEAYNFRFNPGEKVTITIERHKGVEGEYIYLTDHYRMGYLSYMLLAFLILIVLIGGRQGIRAIVSLGLTIISIVYILLPSILKGYNPILISILISIGITIITILLITGRTKKSLAAIIGTSLGVVIAGVISYYIGGKIKLTGLSAEEATMLMYIPQGIDFNFQHLLFAGIILGALGAVMDVGMSIASSIDEIHVANKDLGERELFQAGMNVGRDIMGTMVNTLILAYAGTSIPLLLLFMAYENGMMEIMNMDIIATEIVRSVSGSIGLILTIPVTALVASILIKRWKTEESS